jgi:glucan biosynthesis protein C
MTNGRHYGLDWLRIAAFALLILYHIGMVFAPWDWVIKTGHRYPELIVPMEMVSPWRLALLFAVSGYASRRLFAKDGSAELFARSRASRLLVPLAFGMAVLVPLEMWVLVMENGYSQPYLHFWAFDYWRWGEFYGRIFPSWEHLWFVAYLAVYTFVLAGALHWWGRKLLAAFDALADWAAQGWRLLWLPLAGLVLSRLGLLFVVPEKAGLLTDWSGHAQFFSVFVFGFVLGGSPQLWTAVARMWRPALLLAVITGVIDVWTEVAYPGEAPIGHAMMALDRAARVAMSWGMILVLFHAAQRWWNHDHKWRKPLAEAVFPAYLVHHGVIVLVAWYSLPFKLSAGVEFVLLLAATVSACAATYLVGGRIAWLRPLIGLSAKPLPVAPAAAKLGAAG